MTNIRKSAVNRGLIVFLAGVILVVGFITVSLVRNGIIRSETTAVSEKIMEYLVENAVKGVNAEACRKAFADDCIDEAAARELAQKLSAAATGTGTALVAKESITEAFVPEDDTVRLSVYYRVVEKETEQWYGSMTLSFVFKKAQGAWKISHVGVDGVLSSESMSDTEIWKEVF